MADHQLACGQSETGMNLTDILVNQHEQGTYAALLLSQQSQQQLASWCQEQGIEHQPAEEFHCTVCYSRQPVPHAEVLNGPVDITADITGWQHLGDNATVLTLESRKLQDLHQLLKRHGASHDYPSYLPHVTVNHNQQTLPAVVPDFALHFNHIMIRPLED